MNKLLCYKDHVKLERGKPYLSEYNIIVDVYKL